MKAFGCTRQGVWQALAAPSWKRQSQPLLGALATRIREHNLQLLTRTYTTISVPKVAVMLGIPDSDVAEGAPPDNLKSADAASQLPIEVRRGNQDTSSGLLVDCPGLLSDKACAVQLFSEQGGHWMPAQACVR